MEQLSQQTLASLVSANHNVASVLEKYNLDFCCKGKRNLFDACSEKGLDINKVIREIQSVLPPGVAKRMPFTEMSATQLIDYILVHHHFFVKQSMPFIYTHLEKVATRHGDHFPYMKQVFDLFGKIQHEMTDHMIKEEKKLFPWIKELEKQQQKEDQTSNIYEAIDVMEAEHEHAGDMMFKIRDLTNNYLAPEGACTTFRVSLAELKEFEDDLHTHVHLENNILFNKAFGMLEGRAIKE
jgi:regulator of cell morphogenesis and NO signaling